MKTKFSFSKWTGGAVLAGLTLASVPAFAQEADSLSSEIPSTTPAQSATDATTASGMLPVSASAGLSQQFYSKLKHQNFGFSITRFNVGVLAPYKVSDDFRLDTSFRYGFDYYNWNFLPAGTSEPWQNINTLTLASIGTYKIDDNWSAYGGAFARVSADSDVGLGKGFNGGGLVGANYKFSDTLSLGGGLAIMSQIKDHTAFLPIITANWKFADNWLLTAGLTDIATSGYGIETKWMYDEAWTFGFGLQYHKNRFRIAQANEGVGQEKSTLLYASATWHADPKVDVTGFFGLALGGTVKEFNNSGDQVFYSKYDTAPVIGVKGTMKF